MIDVEMTTYTFDAAVWEHDGPSRWHFIRLPQAVADEVDQRTAEDATAFGSVRVEVSIGTTRWSTSLFPDRRLGTYLLPVNKSVRAAENLVDGSVAHVEVSIAD